MKAELAAYGSPVDAWVDSDPPSSGSLAAAISALLATLYEMIAEIETKQGDHTYAKAKSKIDRLLELRDDRVLALRTQAELEKLSWALTDQATTISAEIREGPGVARRAADADERDLQADPGGRGGADSSGIAYGG